MIQLFADKYNKHIAYSMLIIFYLQTVVMPLHAAIRVDMPSWQNYSYVSNSNNRKPIGNIDEKPFENKIGLKNLGKPNAVKTVVNKAIKTATENKAIDKQLSNTPAKTNIGGPSSPEASSFKAVGSNNLVNLFTGDFSYSIPLLDVGGYPVNLFYTGGIGMEQEASWVGLGWNINPGTVNRNMRGIPDDFNGEDLLKQTQKVKPNRTWGGEMGVDGELLGTKKPKVNLSVGVSYNNYLGPAFELGAGVSISIPIFESIKTEKGVPPDTTVLSAKLGIGGKLSSRSGLTISPSLGANLATNYKKTNSGVGLSTSYNSRTGIRDLNLSITRSKSYTYEYGEKDNRKKGVGETKNTIGSASISFAKSSYMPSLRMPMQYKNYSGQLEGGGGMFGIRGAVHGQGYYSESKVPAESEIVYKPLVGFMYSEKANGNKDAVMDIQRLNDAEVTPNTPILSAPLYNYDVFSVQGEGTGSNIRAYRGDLGFMRDNETGSKDENISIGLDIAGPGHFGINWNVVKTPTRSGGWEEDNNTLKTTMAFKGKKANSSFENIYFKSPGETTVTNPELLDRIGRDNLVRFKLSGGKLNPGIETKLQQFDKKNVITQKDDLLMGAGNSELKNREKRTQVTTMLTAKEASEIGLEKKIRNYAMGSGIINGSNNVNYDTIDRIDLVGGIRKAHHISEINVLEQSGMRYVYGVPVYNITQRDYTFSVAKDPDQNTGIVLFDDEETDRNSRHMNNSARLDGYLMTQETPSYASSFLLTGLLSPDYVDVTGNGVTEDDLGSAVKFDYSKSGIHKWRTPRNNSEIRTAHFNDGLKSIRKDNKATISYGEREVWYLSAIESKAMVAIFYKSYRKDAKGVKSALDGTVNGGEDANKKLDSIRLFTKAEIKAKGINAAIPIKTVNFRYSYSLCAGTPDNGVGEGKLTLDTVFFTYYGRTRANKDKYIFNYQYNQSTAATDNPSYAYQASDKWGTYKSPTTNPGGITNADFPYTSTNKTVNDAYAGAWSLKRILLPSGGQMEVQYEADDYGYVQNRKACNMFKIFGLGDSKNAAQWKEMYKKTYAAAALLSTDYEYVYVQIPTPLQSTNPVAQKQEILERYLLGLGEDEQLAFKLNVEMPKGVEPMTVYAKYDDYGLCTNSPDKNLIYFKIRRVDNKSPLSRAAIGFLTESLPGQAFPASEMEVNSVKDFLGIVLDLLSTLRSAYTGVDNQMRNQGKAKDIELEKSFVRLADPDRIKYGGGSRVKKIIVKDNWNKMTKQYNSTYGQEYDYTTTDQIQGREVTISSGVASYEPGIGSEENPFREIVAFSNKMPLSTAQYGSIEMPMLDGLYPSPGVGYSKVTVRSINRNATLADTTKRLRSAIGKQVTEYFTAKDYPTFSSFTPIDSREYHFNSFFNYFYKEMKDRKTTSQGFLVETNDMHGKMKSQIAYSESDEKTPLSYSLHSYKNTGRNGLNDKVDFVDNATGGMVTKGNMGIDMELMTDVREFKVETNAKNGQLQSDFFYFGPPFPIFALPKLFLKTVTENRYRSVTCTKLINYHAIEDSVIVMDKGSIVSTKTIAYDAETGTAIVTKTANEFKDAIYNVSYPAHWAYSGVGLAYKNIDREFINVTFDNGKISLPTLPNPAENASNIFESGDELYITKPGGGSPNCNTESQNVKKLWAYDTTKNSTALTVVNKSFIFLDEKGNLYNKSGVGFKIVRSGKRNNLGLTVSSATCMENPIQSVKLVINNADKIVSASAVEFKEKWQVDNEVVKRYKVVSSQNLIINGDFSNNSSIQPFASAYRNTPTNTGYGSYHLGPNWPNPSCTPPCYIASCGDHTSGNGNMFFVDGAAFAFPGSAPSYTNPGPDKYFWNQSAFVEPNTTYTFSVWCVNRAVASPPNLLFKINGQQIGTTFQLSSTPLCNWVKYTASWTSVNTNIASISIFDINESASGNDFAIDDVFLGIGDECSQFEVEDCAGYLERSINPYIKGIIGNFKPYRSYTYYGERTEMNTTNPTAIRKNGYLNNFTNYWIFNTAKNLVPDALNTKWVWNSELTKVNSKGQELETKNALDIYTAAQYGFAKNQVTAVANNSRVNEMFAESFEDSNYGETLNTGNYINNCAKNQIDFGGFINANSLGINAHSGKNVKEVSNNGNFSKVVNITKVLQDNFSISYTTDYIARPVSGCGNRISRNVQPSNVSTSACTTIFGSVSMYANQSFLTTPNSSTIRFDETSQQDVQAPYSGFYNFTLQTNVTSVPLGNPPPIEDLKSGLNLKITNLQTGIIIYRSVFKCTVNCLSDNPSETFQIFLACGSYQIESYGYSAFFNTQGHRLTSSFNYIATGLICSSPCSFKRQVPTTDSILNPTFSPIPNKQMHFSAWVREGCTTPCLKTNYNDSKVQIVFNDGSNTTTNITPTGGIIEGWQKVEGDFLIPLTATTMDMRFINTGSNDNYWDDIRVHPYNANMKSYAYDPITLRLSAELDENNYATFYEYDEEGQLIRVKKETAQGIKTIKETRSAKQQGITAVVE
jgi:hypothetical protein